MSNPEILFDWREKAACGNHPTPDLWAADRGSHAARAAIEICEEHCPVRAHCGRSAIKLRERRGIHAGYHTSRFSEWVELHEWLGLPAPKKSRRIVDVDEITATCECGVQYKTNDRDPDTRCPMCRRDMVPAGPARARVEELHRAKKGHRAIAAELGVHHEVIARLLHGQEYIKRSTAEKICGREIAKAS